MGISLHPITNWPQYNKSLINHGSLTFWVDAEAMNNWFHHDHHGRRGSSQLYTDQTICTFLMLKGICNLTLRATQGLLDSLFELMNVPLCAPDCRCVSKRARTVKVAYRQPAKGRITDLVIDSTGLRVFGESEWKARKHSAEKWRIWRKLHLAVDSTNHDIVATEVSFENTHNTEVYRPCSIHCGASWDVFMRMTPMTAKPAIILSRAKGRQPVSRLARTLDSGKRGTQEMRLYW